MENNIPVSGQPNPAKVDDIVLDIQDDSAAQAAANAQNENSINSVKDLFEAVNSWVIEMSPVSLQDKLLFFELLAAMINAGVSMSDALELLQDQTPNQKLVRVIQKMRMEIESGSSLAEAMGKFDDIFDRATCSVVEAGEKSGKLNEILKELVSQYERLNTVGKKIKSVMMYPMIVTIVMVLLAAVVLIFVIPKLTVLFDGASNLPLPTRMMVAASDFILNQTVLLVLGVISVVGGFVYWKKSAFGKPQWDLAQLFFPVFGSLQKELILSRFTRIFGFLISSGVPLTESLKISAHIAENEIYKNKILLAADDLTRGISIAENLSDNARLFPSMLVNMIAIGEKTASLEKIMEKIANFYDESLDRKVENLSKLMEPIILGIISAGAVFMILAIFLPILKMNDQMMETSQILFRFFA